MDTRKYVLGTGSSRHCWVVRQCRASCSQYSIRCDSSVLSVRICIMMEILRAHLCSSGRYGCDDCCHPGVVEQYGPVQFYALAKIHAKLRKADPYHLVRSHCVYPS